jgi:hypothetical protein
MTYIIETRQAIIIYNTLAKNALIGGLFYSIY